MWAKMKRLYPDIDITRNPLQTPAERDEQTLATGLSFLNMTYSDAVLKDQVKKRKREVYGSDCDVEEALSLPKSSKVRRYEERGKVMHQAWLASVQREEQEGDEEALPVHKNKKNRRLEAREEQSRQDALALPTETALAHRPKEA